jgi:nucleoside 2-deoxyribosyltransferase
VAPGYNEPRDRTARAIFLKDVEGVDWSEVVVGNMDGPDPDSGTCWECGYGYKRKRIIVFRSDFRQADEAGLCPFNLMLTESADEVLLLPFRGVYEIAEAIDGAIKRIKQGVVA